MKLHIEEFAELGVDKNGNDLPLPAAPLALQQVESTGASAQSAAFNAATRYLIVTADAPCMFLTGEDPEADANSRYLPANCPRPVAVAEGHKIAVISA